MTDPGFHARAAADTNWNLGNMRNRYMAALTGGGLPGDATEADYEKRLRGFDPQGALTTYATGAWDTIQHGVGGMDDQLRDLKGSAVGAGRLDTGFFDEDQGAVINRGLQSFGSAVAGQSMNAAGMSLRATEDLGALGEMRSTRYLDLLAGGMDRTQAEDNARRQRSADFWNNTIRTVGSVASSALGGRGGM